MRPLAVVLVLIAFLNSFLLTGPVLAFPLDDAGAAYQRSDYKTAFRLLKPIAEKGNVHAQGLLGIMYMNGQGVPLDYAEGAKWTKLAAERGLAEAQLDLGHMYIDGKGVPRDNEEGVKWLRRAAEQGLAEAQLDLGTSYMLRIGVPQDNVLALKWFTLAADRLPDEDMDKKRTARALVNTFATMMTPDQLAEVQRWIREWKPKKER